MHGQMPIVWDRAKGFQVYDKWGNKWIDFTSTIFVTNAGHANPRIVSALNQVLENHYFIHTLMYLRRGYTTWNISLRTPQNNLKKHSYFLQGQKPLKLL